MGKIRKAIVAALGAGVTALVAAWPGGIDPAEGGAIAAAIVTVGLATWAIPNDPERPVA